MEMTLF